MGFRQFRFSPTWATCHLELCYPQFGPASSSKHVGINGPRYGQLRAAYNSKVADLMLADIGLQARWMLQSSWRPASAKGQLDLAVPISAGIGRKNICNCCSPQVRRHRPACKMGSCSPHDRRRSFSLLRSAYTHQRQCAHHRCG